MRRTFYSDVGKRWLDASVALVCLGVALPLLLVVAIAILVTSGGPVFFRQVRVGQFGKPFRIFKFRTMVNKRPSKRDAAVTAAGDPRITSLGRLLRRTKIDELPQLLNALRGEMSLVGPRPEVPEFTAVYTERQRQVLRAKPGITGPAAIFFAHEEDLLAGHPDSRAFYVTHVMPAKLEMDLDYCKNIRLGDDLRLVFLTIAKIVEWKSSAAEPFQEEM